MKAFLLYRDRDVDIEDVLPPNEAALTQDLELDTLFGAMAAGDAFLFDVAKKAVLTSLPEPDAIRYRQHILNDCLEQPAVVREMYAIAVAAIEREKRVYGGLLGRSPDGLLHRSTEVIRLFVDLLKRLRQIAEEHGAEFRSEGFTRLFGMFVSELDDEYLSVLEGYLERLRFRDGVLMSAQLGKGNKGAQYVLRKPRNRNQSWIDRLLFRERSGYVYQIADRDESGFSALSELQGRGIGLVAGALAQSTDHILSFFRMLRSEVGFYVGCLNLMEQLAKKGEPICFPEPLPAGSPMLCGRGLYDVCLSLSIEDRVVGNDVDADHKLLVMITGANRGGKSTFMRSLGLAQLMTQCGMFAPAESFRANVGAAIFTHYKREEDASMRSGKLDEELSRMSSIIDDLIPGSIILLNESFASTNEREGSEIARQTVRALLDSGMKVFYVTHLFDLANGLNLQHMAAALFLRAERRGDGRRTFRIVEGAPLPTSYGGDLYRRIFGSALDAVPAEP